MSPPDVVTLQQTPGPVLLHGTVGVAPAANEVIMSITPAAHRGMHDRLRGIAAEQLRSR